MSHIFYALYLFSFINLIFLVLVPLGHEKGHFIYSVKKGGGLKKKQKQKKPHPHYLLNNVNRRIKIYGSASIPTI